MSLQWIKDKGVEKKIYASFGEIMLRLSPPGFERMMQSPVFEACYGGGEANVAMSLALQGVQSRFITLLPENALGEGAVKFLRGYGVDTSKISLLKGSRIGLYFMEKGANQRPSKVIYDRDNSAISTIRPGSVKWHEVLENCGWFHVTGITPALSKEAAEETKAAMIAASEKGCIVSCDLNYRAKLWNYGVKAPDIMNDLALYTDVIIANEEDCQKSLGISTESDPDKGYFDEKAYEKLMEKVLNKFGNTKVIAITLRESISASHNRWGACISDRNSINFSGKYDITHIVDRVGGGDSFSAGLIYGLSHMDSLSDALEYGVAASCLAHSIEGDVNLSTDEEIMNLYKGDATGRIKR